MRAHARDLSPVAPSAAHPPPAPAACRSRALPAALLTVVVLLALASPAAAHAVLLGSEPGDEATVTEPLVEIVLEFNEPVRDAQVQVADPEGQSIVDGVPDERGEVVVQAVQPPAEHGEYSVAFRVVSADDHPVAGEFTFRYEGPVESAEAAETPVPTPDPTPEATPGETPEPTPEPEEATDEALAATAEDGGPPVGLLALALLVIAAGAAGWAFLRTPGEGDGEAG